MAANSIKAGEAFLELVIKDIQFRQFLEDTQTRVETLGASFEQLGRKMSLGRRLTQFSNGLKSIGQQMSALGRPLSLLGAAFGGAAIAFPVKLAANLEVAEAAFTAMTGSATASRELLLSLQEFSGRSAFSFDALQIAARNMLSFGVRTEQVLPLMKQLAAIAGGDADRLDRLAVAFGQTQAKGRLMAEEVRQMVNAGFNPLQEIARTTGQSMNTLIKAMEKGSISADDVAKAFASAVGPGGRFANILKAIESTATGQFRKLVAGVKLAAIELGQQFLPSLARVLSVLNDLVPKLREFVRENGTLVAALTGIAAVLLGVGGGLTALGFAATNTAAAITLLKTAFGFLAANPVVAALAAIGVAAAVVASKFIDAKLAVGEFAAEAEKLGEKIAFEDPQRLQTYVERYKELARQSKLSAEEQDEARFIIQKLRTEYGDLETRVDSAKGAIVGFDKAQAQIKEAQSGPSVLLLKQIQGQLEREAEILAAKVGITSEAMIPLRGRLQDLAAQIAETEKRIADAVPVAADRSGAVPVGANILGNIRGGLVGSFVQFSFAAKVLGQAAKLFLTTAQLRAQHIGKEFEAGQEIDDEIKQAEIEGIHDQNERKRAQIEEEIRLKRRELEKEGLFNAVNQEKLGKLRERLLRNLKPDNLAARSTFSGQLAEQVFGGLSALPTQKQMLAIQRRQFAVQQKAFDAFLRFTNRKFGLLAGKN
jgi:tape measure domain-containing protein